MRSPKKGIIAAVIGVLGLATAGALTSTITRGATTTTIGGTTYVCTAPVCEGNTLQADPSTMVNTAKAVALIDQGKAALCKTTITGADYAANYAAYAGGYWQQGLSALRLGQALATNKAIFDAADIALEQTTITGKRYCANPAKWPSGQWALAFSTLADGRAFLVANPANAGPSVRVLP